MKEENAEIRLEIIHTKPSGFYIQDIDDVEKITNKDLNFNLTIQAGTNRAGQEIMIKIELDVYHKDNGKEKSKGLFGIKSATVFKCLDFDKVVDSNDKLKVSDEFLRKLFNISIGGIRGMLATKLMVTDFSHITLPLFDLGKMEGKSS